MNIVISQPMFLPWAGFFNQIALADMYIHLDDVAWPRGRSLMNRVQLKTPQGTQWLTVPIKLSTGACIVDIEPAELSWRLKHPKTIYHLLGRAPYFHEMWDLIAPFYDQDDGLSLAEMNMYMIEHISKSIGLKTSFMRSSDVSAVGHGSTKLLGLIKKVGGKTYITGHGAKNYLDHGLFAKQAIDVFYMNYNIIPYHQFFGSFTPFVSVIDALAHVGPQKISDLFASTLTPWKDFMHG